MYISQVIISGYRCFKDTKVPLRDGINMIIGPNNSGKSNLLQAISLALNVNRFINIDDIFCETDVAKLKHNSPQVNITLIITQSEGEPDTSEEAGILAGGYMNKLPTPYEAQLNFRYSLSSEQEDNYLKAVADIPDYQSIWNLIKRDFARFYECYRWGGEKPVSRQNIHDLIDKCDLQFLDALRDVGRDMFMGYNPMLRDVLNFFIDYEIKIDKSKSEDEIKEDIRQKQLEFKDEASPLMQSLLSRLARGKEVMLEYARDSGAAFGNVVPDFSGSLSESELFAVLKLIIRHEVGVEIPATHNGLGYNNLIYMSLLLAKMQADSDGEYMRRQAKVYSLLPIEEPEAHLHPAMQYRFLNFLHENRNKHNVNQIIVTTHSPQIVSAVNIDDIICMYSEGYGQNRTSYPCLAYTDSDSDQESKAYVQRYLDATRSDMFFANKLIFVEGMAEELLIPTFAKYIGIDLSKEHILIVNMGGRYFHHFLKMFNASFYGIHKKVACITDVDPCCDRLSCYPYEFGQNPEKKYTRNADDEIVRYKDDPYIKYFRQDPTYGKTLEYDIALSNPRSDLILIDGMRNEKELKDLMSLDSLDDMKGRLRNSDENTAIIEALNKCNWTDEEKQKAVVASRYLNSVDKGGNALALSLVLEHNISKKNDDPSKVQFNVPQYIKDALIWLLK